MLDILIDGGVVLTMDLERRILGDGAVAIEGDRIVEVGETDVLRRKYSAPKRVINAKNKLVMPGLIDAHVHLGAALRKGVLPGNYGYGNPWIQRHFDLFRPMNEERMYLSALSTCAEMIRGGTTTFIDCGTMGGLEDTTVKAVTESGMRAVLAMQAVDIFGPPGYTLPEKWVRLFGSAEDNIRRIEGLIQKYNKSADGRISVWGCIYQVMNTSDQLCRELKKLADKYKVGITTHANVMKPMAEVVIKAWGKTEIMRLYDNGVMDRTLLIAHATYLPGKDIAAIRDKKVSLAHCIFTSMGLGYGAALFANFPGMLDMGINVALGTDGVTCCNHKDMVRVMNSTFLVHKEAKFDCNLWPPQTVVEMATLNGAKALLLEKEIGSLEAGKKADLILFDLNRPEWVPWHKYNLIENLVLSATGDGIDTTIINGKVVMEGGEIKTFDVKELMGRVQKESEAYLEGIDYLGPEKPYPENMPPLW